MKNILLLFKLTEFVAETTGGSLWKSCSMLSDILRSSFQNHLQFPSVGLLHDLVRLWIVKVASSTGSHSVSSASIVFIQIIFPTPADHFLQMSCATLKLINSGVLVYTVCTNCTTHVTKCQTWFFIPVSHFQFKFLRSGHDIFIRIIIFSLSVSVPHPDFIWETV